MLNQYLQKYLDSVYPGIIIEDRYSLTNKIQNYLSFELGSDIGNGTFRRVKQASFRALEIFNHTFENPEYEIYILIYEFIGKNPFSASNKYLYKLLPKKFYKNSTVKFLNEHEKVIIGKLNIQELNIEEIIRGIINLEMGINPSVYQIIYFFDLKTNLAYHIFDDRSCIIWSDKDENMQTIYNKYKDWIVF